MKYEINVKQLYKTFRKDDTTIRKNVKEAFINASNFLELKKVFSENRSYIKDVLNVELYPKELRVRCEIVNLVKENRAHEIKVNIVEKGMFLKITVEF
ncbi:MAG: hypothetical protein ACRCZ0_08700 [Cetobacterium sp.]